MSQCGTICKILDMSSLILSMSSWLEKSEKLSPPIRALRRCDDWRSCGILDGLLKKEKVELKESNKIQILANDSISVFVYYDKQCKILITHLPCNKRRKIGWGCREIYTFLSVWVSKKTKIKLYYMVILFKHHFVQFIMLLITINNSIKFVLFYLLNRGQGTKESGGRGEFKYYIVDTLQEHF
jgi:hypothetical protein